jgi:chemotaxis protein MotA
MQSKDNKLTHLAIAVGVGLLLTLLLALGANMTAPKVLAGGAIAEESTMHRLFVMFGGSLPSGFIQGFTYFLFVYGLLDIRTKWADIQRENLMFNRELLPVEDNQLLSVEDVEKLRDTATKINGRNPSVFGNLLRHATIAYLANRSPSETLNLVSTQVRIKQADSESEQALMRYVAWAVPSVGFIGTVIGIAAALSIAYKSASNESAIKEITDLLGIAFDSTLVALLLDIIFVYYVHDLQERNEKLYAKMETYLIENFINRVRK